MSNEKSDSELFEIAEKFRESSLRVHADEQCEGLDDMLKYRLSTEELEDMKRYIRGER